MGTTVVAPETSALPPAARELLDAAGARDAELGRAWFDNLQRTVYGDDAGVRYIAAMNGERCRVVLPVRFAPRGAIRALVSLSNFYTSLYAPALAGDATEDDLVAALRAALVAFKPVHEVRFQPMDPESRAFGMLESALKRCGFRPFRFFCFGNWHLPV